MPQEKELLLRVNGLWQGRYGNLFVYVEDAAFHKEAWAYLARQGVANSTDGQRQAAYRHIQRIDYWRDKSGPGIDVQDREPFEQARLRK